MWKTHDMLGLALGERSIQVAEVRLTGGAPRVARAGRFDLPPGSALEDPAATGRRLRAFLNERGFGSRRAVLGLSARWMLVREKTLPPGDAGTRLGLLQLAVERELTGGENGGVAADFSGPLAGDTAHRGLLVAIPRQRLEQLRSLCAAAKLSLCAVTSSTMVLALAGAGETGAGLVLCLHDDGAELALRQADQVQWVRRLTAGRPAAGIEPPALVDTLGEEVRRVMALLPGDGRRDEPLHVWNGTRLDPAAWERLGTRLSRAVRVCSGVADLGLTELQPPPADEHFALPAALAVAGLEPRRLPIDLVHSHLAPPPRRRLGRRAIYGAAAGVLVTALVLWAVQSQRAERRELAALESDLAAVSGRVEEARAMVERTSFARRWFDRRSPMLDVLRGLSTVFPEDGRAWATKVTVGADLHIQIIGKASDERSPLEINDRLKADPQFQELLPRYLRQVEGGREVGFALDVRHVPAEEQP